MRFRVSPTPDFLRDIKHLAKRYPSIRTDVEAWGESFEVDPAQGTPIGRNCYKVRGRSFQG
jgi:mRNA-degrading endonuclease RelE of RelBE toxin-antitoxin system